MIAVEPADNEKFELWIFFIIYGEAKNSKMLKNMANFQARQMLFV